MRTMTVALWTRIFPSLCTMCLATVNQGNKESRKSICHMHTVTIAITIYCIYIHTHSVYTIQMYINYTVKIHKHRKHFFSQFIFRKTKSKLNIYRGWCFPKTSNGSSQLHMTDRNQKEKSESENECVYLWVWEPSVPSEVSCATPGWQARTD